MKYLVLANVISNGGDYLIRDCSLALLNKTLGEGSYDFINLYSNKITDENVMNCKAIIYFGGPLYSNRMIENILIDVYKKACSYNKKIFILGCGWYGAGDAECFVNEYRFSDKAIEVLRYINNNGVLGCRDFLTGRILNNNGLNNTIITGCPVLYQSMNQKKALPTDISRIAVSDMGVTKDKTYNEEKYSQVVQVLKTIRDVYPNSSMIFTFNNGIKTKYSCEFNEAIAAYLTKEDIPYYELSNSSEMFSIYDDIDIHIGFRVHSHLYCISKGIPSILISEDARGAGINEYLGLNNINNNTSWSTGFVPNAELSRDLAREIKNLNDNIQIIMDKIDNKIEDYWLTGMSRFIKMVENE